MLAGLNFSWATVNFSVSFSQKLALKISSGVKLTWSSAMLVILNLTRGLLSLSSMQLPAFFFVGNHSKISSRPYFHWVTGEITHAGCWENMFKFFIKLIFSFWVRRHVRCWKTTIMTDINTEVSIRLSIKHYLKWKSKCNRKLCFVESLC